MAKNTVIIFFIACFISSIWIFLSREKGSLREHIESVAAQDEPRVELERFLLRKYVDGHQSGQIQGEQAAFRAPNLVEVVGQIRAWQWKAEHQQLLRSDRANIYFYSESLIDLCNRSSLESASLSGAVEIHYQDHILYSEEANYIAGEEKIYGNQPVRVTGPGHWFRGIGGFRLFLDEELLDVYGKVRGMHSPVL